MHNYKNIIKRFKGKNILVIGDLILDHYIWGRVERISPEAPVPVVDVIRETFMTGGAANVAHNVMAMGGRATLVGVAGKDRAGEALVAMLQQEGVNCGGVFNEARPTTVKTRVIAHNQQVVRFDREDKNPLGSRVLREIGRYIDSNFSAMDAVIISDYNKGMITQELVRNIARKARALDVFVAVDPKIGHFDFYKGVALITPNVIEASSGSGVEITDDASLEKAGRRLLRRLKCKAVLITRGEQGMSLFQDDSVIHIPTVARKVFDVTGAGDTVIAAFTVAHAAGASMEEASVLANHAAGVVVAEVGTAVATSGQIMQSFS